MLQNLLAIGKGIWIDVGIVLYIMLSFIIGLKTKKRLGSLMTSIFSILLCFVLIIIGKWGGQLMQSWFGIEETFRAKFEAMFLSSEKYAAELSALSYKEVMEIIPFSKAFKSGLSEYYAVGVEPGVTVAAYISKTFAQRAAASVFVLGGMVVSFIVVYIVARCILHRKYDIWYEEVDNATMKWSCSFMSILWSLLEIFLILCLFQSLKLIDILDSSFIYQNLFANFLK